MKIVLFLTVTALLLSLPTVSFADEQIASCQNRFLTLVNPVRSRSLWHDGSLKPIEDQYGLISTKNLPASWLLQYDTLADAQLLSKIKSFDNRQEEGVLLEVSQKMADDARIVYPVNTPWSYPQAVFLSGYSQSDRKKLIDLLFGRFKNTFGFYPSAVGAWWIDSYSLDYIKDKYNIKTAMIVADQKTTDSYGVWGQWWGVPYYPAKANLLVPAGNLNDKLDVVIIQWAQRDPLLARGEGPGSSNYSLQANDYISQGKDIDYFKNLVSVYLDCRNSLGQVTVGLETGIESVGYISEYAKQLDYLTSLNYLTPVTMSQFHDAFAKVYPTFPDKMVIQKDSFRWEMTPPKRISSENEVINYNSKASFSDYFVADKASFLNRQLNQLKNKNEGGDYHWLFWLVILGLGILAYFKKLFKIWLLGGLFLVSAFGLVLRSGYQFGWKVFYGLVIDQLLVVQIVLILLSFLLI
ncbi:hypothetical protein HY389_00385 [Candidatus Daviesbacteria bacterium]|nr:hypothetical protein [Candidatus Daviesbacteria bacterium]